MKNFVMGRSLHSVKWAVLALCCVAGLSGRVLAQDDAKEADTINKMPSLMMLDESDKVWSLSVGADSRLTVQKGDIVINSSNKGALWLTNGALNDLDGQILCVGGINNMGKTTPRPAPVLGAAPQDDPVPNFRVPPPERVISQQKLFLNNQPEVTLPPGIYNDGIFATATIRLSPCNRAFISSMAAIFSSPARACKAKMSRL